MEQAEIEKLQAELAEYNQGVIAWHRFSSLLPRVVLSDGVKFLADSVGCYWIFDQIGPYMPGLMRDEANYELKITIARKQNHWYITAYNELNRIVINEFIERSTFPLEEFTFYGTWDGEYFGICLKSERD